MLRSLRLLRFAPVSLALAACGDDPAAPPTPRDPDTAPVAAIDRFSATAGNLFVRSAGNGLPGANQPVNFDQAPFITQGLGPDGEIVRYYNFDVMPTTPAPIFVLFREGETAPVAGQLNIIDVIPDDQGYSDFWQVVRVTVPRNYVANTVTSVAEIVAAGFTREATTIIVNCPVVPSGSTAALGGGANGLVRGWYRDQVVFYFDFNERPLSTTTGGLVATSPIFVAFNTNPDQPGGGPPSGFRTELGGVQTHNVVATLPADAAYSPLWSVNVYDNADFNAVQNLATAQAATILGTGVALVNCPVVSVSP